MASLAVAQSNDFELANIVATAAANAAQKTHPPARAFLLTTPAKCRAKLFTTGGNCC
jgi:hypothetical protein